MKICEQLLLQFLLLTVNIFYRVLVSAHNSIGLLQRSSSRFKEFSLRYLVVGSSLVWKKKEKLTEMFTSCHSLSLVVPLVVISCHSLCLFIIRCHSLSLVVIRYHSLYHSLSLVVPFVVIRFHSLPFVVICCTTRCYSMYQSSVIL